MSGEHTLEVRTERLHLRRWTADDREALAALNADPLVMEFFPRLLSSSESAAEAERIDAHFERHGFGPWVVDIPGVTPFAGVVGLWKTSFTAPFTPCVEVAWRLAHAHWGRGFAVEAARAAVAFGFENLGLTEIVSFTVPQNRRSRRVMERLGMTRAEQDDFDHPRLPAGHPLRRHVLYRLSAAAWKAATAPGIRDGHCR